MRHAYCLPRMPAQAPTAARSSSCAQVVLLDNELRRQLLRAFTEDDRLHVDEVARLLRLVQVCLCGVVS